MLNVIKSTVKSDSLDNSLGVHYRLITGVMVSKIRGAAVSH